jgi:hypothetical protein
MASRQFATFEVANQLFGVEVHTGCSTCAVR